MKLVIDIINRAENDYLAIACPEGALLSDAGVGGGDTERAAVQQAVNGYFSRYDDRQRAAHPVSYEPEPFRPVTGTLVTAQVAVDPVSIERLLTQAAASNGIRRPTDPWIGVRISGTKINGDTYQDRLVAPLRIDKRLCDYLICRDLNVDEERVFRLDGVERAELRP